MASSNSVLRLGVSRTESGCWTGSAGRTSKNYSPWPLELDQTMAGLKIMTVALAVSVVLARAPRKSEIKRLATVKSLVLTPEPKDTVPKNAVPSAWDWRNVAGRSELLSMFWSPCATRKFCSRLMSGFTFFSAIFCRRLCDARAQPGACK